jgi:hypothetical protein
LRIQNLLGVTPKKVRFKRVEKKFEKNLFFHLTAQRSESNISSLLEISNVAEQLKQRHFLLLFLKS